MSRNSTVDALRAEIDSNYREAINALEILAKYLQSAEKKSESQTPPAAPDVAPNNAVGITTADRVRQVIADKFKTVDEIVNETGLSEASVRAVLYAKSALQRIQKTKRKKKMYFKLKSQEPKTELLVPKPEINSARAGDNNAAALVRELLTKNSRGMRSREIHAALEAEMERLGINTAAIGAALYNMKKRGKLSYSRATGVYAISSDASVAD